MGALHALGHEPKLLDQFLTSPADAIDTLSGIDDPMIGLYAHWVYGPHTTDGVVGHDAPLLLASNFDGTWPGLVGLLNTGACLTSLGRAHSRLWSDAADLTTDEWFMESLDTWVRTGSVDHDAGCIHDAPAPHRVARGRRRVGRLRAKRPLAAMLGDTSMGMINGYFGPQRLARVGFSEHKIDQAWLIEQGKTRRPRARRRRLRVRARPRRRVPLRGDDFTESATREQLRDYCAVLDLLAEFRADCLGLAVPARPDPVAAAVATSPKACSTPRCRPETNGSTIVDCAPRPTRATSMPMELLKRLLLAHGLHESVAFHDVRWGGEHDGRFVWVLLNSGSAGAYAFNHDPDTLRGVHSYRQPPAYFPIPGGTFAGESLPGAITWARAWLDGERARDGRRPRRGGRAARRRCAMRGGRARPGSGRSWRPTSGSGATTSWRTTRATTSPSRTETCSPTWWNCRAGWGSASACWNGGERRRPPGRRRRDRSVRAACFTATER